MATGAASGIGRGISLRFAQGGAKVAIVDINLKGAEKVADQIRKEKGQAITIKTDVRNHNQVRAAIENVVNNWGKIDILVNNAGISLHATILDEDVRQKWHEVIETNLNGSFIMTEAVTKAMVENGWSGNIINITSVHSQVPSTNGAYYMAAKAGLVMATKAWALELALHSIRVNAIAPGAIRETGMNKDIDDKNDRVIARKLNIPLGRHGLPEEIADAAIFLATNEYTTGHELVVDGGFLLTH